MSGLQELSLALTGAIVMLNDLQCKVEDGKKIAKVIDLLIVTIESLQEIDKSDKQQKE